MHFDNTKYAKKACLISLSRKGTMRINCWTEEDIKKIRCCFIEGLQIKDIAKELNRTPTAINKALSRFNIRPIRQGIEVRSSLKENKTCLAKKPSFEIKSLHREIDNWVSFCKLCDYLAQQKVRFYEVTKAGVSLEQRQFKVGEKILSTRELMMMANKIRFEKNLGPLFVRGVSW